MSSPATPDSDRLKKLRQQQEELAQKIRLEESRLKEQARKDDTRRKIIVGAVALDLANNHSQFRALLYEAMNQAVTAERDRDLLGLAGASSVTPPPIRCVTAARPRRSKRR
ncbi:hypothetical protein E4P82_20195, partial [Candidatus Competibacter phosphatis]